MNPRFEINKEQTTRKTVSADVITDTKTGVQYLAYRDNVYGSSGITVLVDSDGKPLIDKRS
ncbi:DUF6440 family protein [Enterococcus termitis]|jgi:hypothetical protein|uniref:DUF6440 domain-containing protein n=1 Tax=Enterococcus termitis TaxID=332950 RepID=A0A1E5GSX2_9ENTE|nr:DUF6440 family protein [Enterococcus termitis]OEG15765.1 hypothetical protein BCR25_18635 [Enterococcus termitis]OJG96649.1 hypothetical protein RV18_GL002015 [Enterococcus termitis]